MAKGIVMLHGANAGGWCFERFRTVFESLGWTCHTPDLIGHGRRRCNLQKSPALVWRITAFSYGHF